MKSLLQVALLLLVLASCQNKQSNTGKPKTEIDKALEDIDTANEEKRDLPDLKEDSVINVITMYNSTSYFLYRGQAMGFEYDLAEQLADSLNLELKIKVAEDFDDVFKMLIRGEGDIVAFGLSITEPRKKYVAFSKDLFSTHQVLVQRKPENWRELPMYKIKQKIIDDPVDLIGDTVYVKKNTSYYARLKNLEEEIGGDIHIKTIKGGKTTDDIINMVVDGDIDYTVADYNLASVNQTYYPILDIETAISFSQRIGWALRKSSLDLLDAVNNWIDHIKEDDLYYILYAKYFKDKKSYNRRVSSDLFSKKEGKISQYDKIIRENAQFLDWDWRLLTSLVYQESQFKVKNQAWTGAGGLMQIMPATAKELGLMDIHNPEDNLRAGTAYLQSLQSKFGEIRDSIQQIKFTMAAYNCGLGHVEDARRLARNLEKDANQWDGNVEDVILKLQEHKYFTRPEVHYGYVRGSEPYNYVRDIFKRYKDYRTLIPLGPQGLINQDSIVQTL